MPQASLSQPCLYTVLQRTLFCSCKNVIYKKNKIWVLSALISTELSLFLGHVNRLSQEVYWKLLVSFHP